MKVRRLIPLALAAYAAWKRMSPQHKAALKNKIMAQATGGLVTAGAHDIINVRAIDRLNLQINDIDLPGVSYVSKLATARVNYSFSTSVFLNALVQYNTDTNQWSSNVRLDIMHRPLSDIYLVYNERHDARSGALISRAGLAKMTYLYAF